MEMKELVKPFKKRLFAEGEHVQNVQWSPVKHRAVSAIRSPPSTSTTLNNFEDSPVPDTSGSTCVAIDSVPLTVVAPAGVHFEIQNPTQSISLRKQGRSDDDDDCVIIERDNDICRGNGNWVDSDVWRETPVESASESRVDDCSDDTEVLILSLSEWNSAFKRERRSENDIAVQCSQKEIIEVDSDDEKIENGDDLNDLSTACYEGEGDKSGSRKDVVNARKVFDKLCEKLLDEICRELKGGSCHVYARVASHMKKDQEWVNTEPRMGHVPGVEVGDHFGSRAELVVVGLHHEFMAGINWMKLNGKKCAISIVDSGRYENKTISNDAFVYSGHGGNEKLQKAKADQKLEGGNLALKNSMDEKFAVRVIRKHIEGASGRHIYVYEGLYAVSNFWLERLPNDQAAYMFEMTRMPDQLYFMGRPDYKITKYEQKVSKGNHVHSMDDLSNGKEKISIRVVNEINGEKPLEFTYITEMKYPSHMSSLSGCGCIDGCSDNELCRCGIENGGELPFNEEGRIVRVRRSLVRECGPSCKCPPSCQNRVSQHGIRYRLEVFKTKSTGWGVRSPDSIPSGGFICEYIGELLQDKEAEERIDDDEYLFDLDNKNGFTIDALKYGNVGRFINHSCSPNLYAQKVLYDNPDKKTPHIMFFATEDLPPLTELTYDYNYSIGRVCDAFGNIKIKICHCGSHECIGRLY